MRVVKRRVFPGGVQVGGGGPCGQQRPLAGAVATELGLHETVLRRWMMQFGTQARGTPRRSNTQAVSPSPSDLVAEVARLRRENGQLRMERDILKKAAPHLRQPLR